jgi:hypothetical protein
MTITPAVVPQARMATMDRDTVAGSSISGPASTPAARYVPMTTSEESRGASAGHANR